MSNETKQDVFARLAEDLKINDSFDEEYPKSQEDIEKEYKENIHNYDAALPDDLPVIPKVWGDTIEKFKANHYRLSEIFTEWDWNYDEQELIARAWVLGAWCVEETGEIVKLEAEK